MQEFGDACGRPLSFLLWPLWLSSILVTLHKYRQCDIDGKVDQINISENYIMLQLHASIITFYGMLYWRIYLYTEWRVGSGIVTLAILLFLNTMPLAIERPAPHCHWPIFNLFNMKYTNFLSLIFRRIWKCSGQGPDKNRYCTVFFVVEQFLANVLFAQQNFGV